MGDKLIEAEADRDDWRQNCRGAEARAATIHAKLIGTEAQLAVVKRSLEDARDGIGELTKQLQEADARADRAACDTYAAEARAEDANQRAAEANDRARAAEARAEGAETAAADADRRSAEADRRAREAEARAERAEARLAAGEGDQSLEDRVRADVRKFLASTEYQVELADAASDAYLKGFEYCKRKVAAIYRLEGLDAVQPSDDEETDEEEAEEGSKASGQ